MAFEFDSDGLTVETLQEIYDLLVAGYKSIYGSQINLDADTPDGQVIAIQSQERLDIETFCLWLYNMIDPDFSVGDAQDRMIKWNGLKRLSGDYSQAELTVVTSKALTIPKGWVRADTLGQNWVTLAAWSLGSGSNTITVFAENEGAIEAAAGTITETVTVVLGVTSTTNAADATPGRDEETDEELRIRRRQSTENPVTSSVGGLYSALGDILNVSSINIVENKTDDYDATNDLDAHTTWVIVEGGSTADIAEAIVLTETGGSPLKGSTIGEFTETVTYPDGSTFDIVHQVPFDRPTSIDLHIQMDAEKSDASISIDQDGIKAALVARTYRIGESAQSGKLYATAYGAGDTAIISNLEISLNGSAWVEGALAPDADEKFVIDIGDITITEI